MRAVLALVALALVGSAIATTASTTVGCQTVTITPASGSICKSASGQICSTAAGAQLIQTSVTAAWSALTSQVVTATGTVACAAIGGTIVNDFWTNPTTWGCDGTNPDPCDATTCGTTATQPVTTTLPCCCSSIRSRISSACSNVPNLDTLVTSAGNCSASSAILSALSLPCACADSNCRDCSSAATASASILALLLAALLALFNL